jgi:hypothetical protein
MFQEKGSAWKIRFRSFSKRRFYPEHFLIIALFVLLYILGGVAWLQLR